MAPPRRTSVRSKSWAWHGLLAAGSIWSCHCFANLWEDLFSSPDQWVDHRCHKADKKTRQFPDFKRKTDGKGLWIENEKTPAWVEEKLNVEGNLWTSISSKDDLWQHLIDSPHEWEDFRTKKPSPKFPDFKRKADGISLWFDSFDTPDWVATKLMEIEDKLATWSSSKEHLWQDLIDSPRKWEDFRTKKPSPRFPDFKRRADGVGLWFDSFDTPDWVATKLMAIEDKLATWSSSKEHLWQDLIDSPHEWEDLRTKKPSPKFPDFKRKADGISLWLDSKSIPDWVETKLMEIEDKLATWSSSKEHLWQDLIDSPHEWEDFRTKKPSPKFPDFKRKADGISLWFDSFDTPDWVATKLMEIEDKLAIPEVGNFREPLQSPDFFPKLTDPAAIESLWTELFGPDEQGWLDYREGKKLGSFHPGHPDFIKDHTRQGLWCDDTAPEWAIEKLKELDAENV